MINDTLRRRGGGSYKKEGWGDFEIRDTHISPTATSSTLSEKAKSMNPAQARLARRSTPWPTCRSCSALWSSRGIVSTKDR
jgi:hypothetical protein